MNPVVVFILISSNPKQNVPYIFNTEIHMQILAALYYYLYLSPLLPRKHFDVCIVLLDKLWYKANNYYYVG